jgi:predicted secreted protein
MGWLSALAIFFIIWWVVLFVMLPIGLRTQDEDHDVTLGTTPSAPSGRHMRAVLVRTTLVSLAAFGLYWLVTTYLGLGIDDIPYLGPRT